MDLHGALVILSATTLSATALSSGELSASPVLSSAPVHSSISSENPLGSGSSFRGGSDRSDQVVVDQGQIYYFINSGGDRASCMVGYVNRQERTLFTAAHCGDVGTEISDVNGRVIGMVESTSRPAGIHHTVVGDFAVVRLAPNAEPGANALSTDALVPLADIKVGDTLCSVRLCGPVRNIHGGNRWIEFESANIEGDSGGPVWKVDAQGNPVGTAGVVGTLPIDRPDATWSTYAASWDQPLLGNERRTTLSSVR